MDTNFRHAVMLGRRVERLLLAGAALMLVALAAFYFSFAARYYTEDRLSHGLENLALLVEGDDKVLQRFHELELQREKLAAKKKEVTENFYVKALEDKIARAAALSGEPAAELRRHVDATQAPGDIARALRERKRQIDERPASVAGLTVPGAGLGSGTAAAFTAHALILALGPLVILWLGALYASRRQELAAAHRGGVLFPHLLNWEHMPLEALVLRHARRWGNERIDAVRRGVLAFFRMAVIAMLIVPIIGSYVGALVNLGNGIDGGWLRFLYSAVVLVIALVQSVALLAAESKLFDLFD